MNNMQGFSPPKEYVTLLRSATLAGYNPTEKEKEWLVVPSQNGADDNGKNDSK